MSTAQAPQAQIAKRLQLSRDQKALLETVYAMEKLPQRQNPTGVITNSRCGLYCTPRTRRRRISSQITGSSGRSSAILPPRA